jgi:hypothetical protein
MDHLKEQLKSMIYESFILVYEILKKKKKAQFFFMVCFAIKRERNEIVKCRCLKNIWHGGGLHCHAIPLKFHELGRIHPEVTWAETQRE